MAAHPASGAEGCGLPSLIDRLRSGLSPDSALPAAPAHPADLDWWPPVPIIPAAVLIPIVRRPEPSVLLTTRTENLRRHSGQIAFPGGRIDPTDAGPVQAALREAHEEVGLDPAEVEIFGLAAPFRTGTGFLVQPVVGAMPPDLPLHPNPGEVADIFEVPLAFVLDRRRHQQKEAEFKGRLRRYHVIEWQGRHIWGATAGMLVHLAELLA